VIASNLTYPHKSLLKVVHPNSEAGKPSGHWSGTTAPAGR
jgi:hypothetical protein